MLLYCSNDLSPGHVERSETQSRLRTGGGTNAGFVVSQPPPPSPVKYSPRNDLQLFHLSRKVKTKMLRIESKADPHYFLPTGRFSHVSSQIL